MILIIADEYGNNMRFSLFDRIHGPGLDLPDKQFNRDIL